MEVMTDSDITKCSAHAMERFMQETAGTHGKADLREDGANCYYYINMMSVVLEAGIKDKKSL